MNWVNYDDVLRQLQEAGLLVTGLDVGERRRCRVDGLGKERRGWYHLHVLRLAGGDEVLVGSYGIWQGNNPGSTRVELAKGTALSAEQRAALKARISEDRKAEEARRRGEAQRAARRAQAMWARLEREGDSDYLRRKCVQGHGVRFSEAGTVVIPMLDAGGLIHGLQLIYPAGHQRRKKLGRDKDFWPPGLAKQGHFFMLGSPTVGVCCLVAEGYATGATLHEATGLPVAVAFDAGNLVHVATALRARHRGLRLLMCADDDYLGKCRACGELTPTSQAACTHCGEPSGTSNAGITGAESAALAVDGAWVAPTFADDRPLDRKGPTDFNDLHVGEGLQVVRAQVERRLAGLKWTGRPQAAPTHHTAGEGEDGGGGDLRCIGSLEELYERFALVYEAADVVFDAQEHTMVPLSSMRNLCPSRQMHRNWMESQDKRVVRLREVGFDPTETDPAIKCNLWAGWPTRPKAGSCDKLLELGEYLCSKDPRGPEVWTWLLKWLAYPIQHPGAKMKTAVIMHGPQGTGKNLFFEAVMRIYGQYGRMLNQEAVEDKFNDWASRLLFGLCDEFVARRDVYDAKNKLKTLITGDMHRINPKGLTPYWERNHANFVFLSNELQPSALERDDRRHAVIWTQDKREAAFYREVLEEINNGGVEALHDFLLQVDTSDFHQGTLPPTTAAKEDLIALGQDSTERFFADYMGDKQGSYLPLPRQSCRSMDLYAAYRHYCHLNGVAKPAQMATFVGALCKRAGVQKGRHQHFKAYSHTITTQSEIITPPGAQLPPDRMEISKSLNGFAEALAAWRDESLAAVRPKGGVKPAAHEVDDEPF